MIGNFDECAKAHSFLSIGKYVLWIKTTPQNACTKIDARIPLTVPVDGAIFSIEINPSKTVGFKKKRGWEL